MSPVLVSGTLSVQLFNPEINLRLLRIHVHRSVIPSVRPSTFSPESEHILLPSLPPPGFRSLSSLTWIITAAWLVLRATPSRGLHKTAARVIPLKCRILSSSGRKPPVASCATQWKQTSYRPVPTAHKRVLWSPFLCLWPHFVLLSLLLIPLQSHLPPWTPRAFALAVSSVGKAISQTAFSPSSLCLCHFLSPSLTVMFKVATFWRTPLSPAP